MSGARIRVVLRRRGRYPIVAIDDDGRGMSPERLREVAQNLFKSVKADDERTLGEKAIGLLAFQQLGGRCEVVTRLDGSPDTWALKLHRGKATAELVKERRRARSGSGTTVYLADLDPEVLRTITQRKVVDYLRRRRGAALARGDYTIEVQEGRTVEIVTPERPDGLRVPLAPQRTLWGTIEFNIFVAPDAVTGRAARVVGRAGTTILDSITEIEEFDDVPWASGQVAGEVVFPGLQQTAGRRSILRDRDAFPVFVAAPRRRRMAPDGPIRRRRLGEEPASGGGGHGDGSGQAGRGGRDRAVPLRGRAVAPKADGGCAASGAQDAGSILRHADGGFARSMGSGGETASDVPSRSRRPRSDLDLGPLAHFTGAMRAGPPGTSVDGSSELGARSTWR